MAINIGSLNDIYSSLQLSHHQDKEELRFVGMKLTLDNFKCKIERRV